MKFNDYLEKLRSKPAHERQRIAAVATGVAFAVIFLIWIISFNEMNKSDGSSETQTGEQSPADNFSSGKASIEEMFQGLPTSDGTDSASGIDNSGIDINSGDANGNVSENVDNSSIENQSQDTNSSQDNQQEIPALP